MGLFNNLKNAAKKSTEAFGEAAKTFKIESAQQILEQEKSKLNPDGTLKSKDQLRAEEIQRKIAQQQAELDKLSAKQTDDAAK